MSSSSCIIIHYWPANNGVLFIIIRYMPYERVYCCYECTRVPIPVVAGVLVYLNTVNVGYFVGGLLILFIICVCEAVSACTRVGAPDRELIRRKV